MNIIFSKLPRWLSRVILIAFFVISLDLFILFFPALIILLQRGNYPILFFFFVMLIISVALMRLTWMRPKGIVLLLPFSFFAFTMGVRIINGADHDCQTFNHPLIKTLSSHHAKWFPNAFSTLERRLSLTNPIQCQKE